MITVTIGEMLGASNVFKEIIKQSVSGTTAFKIARLVREIDKEVELFEAQRVEIVKKYCEKNEDGTPKAIDEQGSVRILPENMEECNKELTALVGTEVELNASKLPISCLDELTISTQDIIAIQVFIEE